MADGVVSSLLASLAKWREGGIQDRVSIVRPDGTRCRYLPEEMVDSPWSAHSSATINHEPLTVAH